MAGSKTPGGVYTFNLPSLPKPTYIKLRELGAKYGLTSYQVVVIALDLLAEADKAQPGMVEGVVAAFKTQS
jgi:hypothetical protein